MAAPDDDEEEYEICNDDGFVYKRRRGLYPDVAPTSVQAAGPDPEAVRRRRRRRVLRRLLEERRRELKSWEALDRKVQAQQAAPLPTPPQVPPASPGAATTNEPPASSSGSPGPAATVDRPVCSLLRKVHAHLKVREKIVEDLTLLCNEFEELHGAYIASWPVWGDPKELGSLQSPDSPGSSSDGLRNELSFERDYLNEGNESWRIRVESAKERGETITEGLGNARTKTHTGKFHSTGVQQLVHNIEVHEQDKLMQQVDSSNDPSTLSEIRKKKRVASPHGSRSVKKPRTRQSNRNTA